MRKRLNLTHPPLLAAAVRCADPAEAIAAIRSCALHGADMIDLHISCLNQTDDETLARVIGSSPRPVLALNYNQTLDWRDAGLSEDERAESLLRAVDAGAAGIDMQGYTFDLPSKAAFHGDDHFSFTQGAPKEVVTDEAIIEKQIALIERVHEKGAQVLLSCHTGCALSAEAVRDLALYLEKRGADVIKIVTTAATRSDLFEAIHAMPLLLELHTPVAYHANGAAGRLSRLINPLLGGAVAFCADHYDAYHTPEQLDLATARQIIDGAEGMTDGIGALLNIENGMR